MDEKGENPEQGELDDADVPTASRLSDASERLRGRAAVTEVPGARVLDSRRRHTQRQRTARVGSAAAAVLLLLAGLGWWSTGGSDRTDEVVADVQMTTTTIDPTVGRLDLGAPVPCPPESSGGFDLTEEQTAGTVRRPQGDPTMMDTVAAATAYADSQPDMVAVGYDNDSAGSLVVAVFTGDLDRHLAELRSQVPLPDSVVVRSAPATLAQMEQVQADLQDQIRTNPFLPDGAVQMSGPRWDGLQIQMTADQLPLALDVATRLAGIQFLIGAKRYTSDESGALRRCEQAEPIAVPDLPTGDSLVRTDPAERGLISYKGGQFPVSGPAGAQVGRTYVLGSDESFSYQAPHAGPLEAVIVRAGTDEVVGAAVLTMRRLVLPSPVVVGPGEDLTIEIEASTASADTSDDPALPPGEYEMVASVEIEGTTYVLPRSAFTLADPAVVNFGPGFCAGAPSCGG